MGDGSEPPSKRVRVVDPDRSLVVRQDGPSAMFLVDFRGDSENAIEWVNGRRRCDSVELRVIVCRIQEMLHMAWANGLLAPMEEGGL